MTKLTDLVDRLEADNAQLRQDKAELVKACALAFRAMLHDSATFKSLEPAATAMRKLQATIAKTGKES